VTVPKYFKHLLRWSALAFVLHGLWEMAQLPLYALWHEATALRIAVYVLHCLIGDVLIAMFI
jgi:RsiW-degrading membrane proteinase PrsW (M82 family)